jgi:hypothetical protein
VAKCSTLILRANSASRRDCKPGSLLSLSFGSFLRQDNYIWIVHQTNGLQTRLLERSMSSHLCSNELWRKFCYLGIVSFRFRSTARDLLVRSRSLQNASIIVPVLQHLKQAHARFNRIIAETATKVVWSCDYPAHKKHNFHDASPIILDPRGFNRNAGRVGRYV